VEGKVLGLADDAAAAATADDAAVDADVSTPQFSVEAHFTPAKIIWAGLDTSPATARASVAAGSAVTLEESPVQMTTPGGSQEGGDIENAHAGSAGSNLYSWCAGAYQLDPTDDSSYDSSSPSHGTVSPWTSHGTVSPWTTSVSASGGIGRSAEGFGRSKGWPPAELFKTSVWLVAAISLLAMMAMRCPPPAENSPPKSGYQSFGTEGVDAAPDLRSGSRKLVKKTSQQQSTWNAAVAGDALGGVGTQKASATSPRAGLELLHMESSAIPRKSNTKNSSASTNASIAGALGLRGFSQPSGKREREGLLGGSVPPRDHGGLHTA
jgi:hypothetical protein